MPERRWVRIIPVALIMYTIAFVDRTNISLALPSMSRELGMNPQQAGDAAGIFFWGYLLLQIPGGYLAQRWSAKRFVAILLVFWGLCSMATGLIHTRQEFWVMRLLLGVAEGGVWPATLVLLSSWFPRAERARANAYWMLCLPVAVIVSSPFSGWILGRWNWRVLLVSEGALPLVWLMIWWYFIYDHPDQAPWISSEEQTYLETTLHREAGELEPVTREHYLAALLRPQVLMMIVIYVLQTTGSYGYVFWLPSALRASASAVGRPLTNFEIGVLNAVPYVITAIGMTLISKHSDRYRERRLHVSLALAFGGILLMLSVLTSNRSPLLSFLFVCFVGAGAFGSLGPFWAIPTETLPRNIAGSAMGLINAIGNLGGWAGPLLVGYLNRRTGTFFYAFAALSLSMLTGSVIMSVLPIGRKAPAGPVLSEKLANTP
jgi:MFS family permease